MTAERVAAAELIDALRSRGWRVLVDEGTDRAGSRRVTATAWRTLADAATGVPFLATLRATKPTEVAALAELLAKALERKM